MERKGVNWTQFSHVYLGQLTAREWSSLIMRSEAVLSQSTSEQEPELNQAPGTVKVRSGSASSTPTLAVSPSQVAVALPQTETPSLSPLKKDAPAEVVHSSNSNSPVVPLRSSESPKSTPRAAPEPVSAGTPRLRWASVVSGDARADAPGASHESNQSSVTTESKLLKRIDEADQATGSDRRGRLFTGLPAQMSERLLQLLEYGCPVSNDRTPSPSVAASSIAIDPHWRRPGFVNTGNSCYLNAVLQALLAIDEFRLTWTALGALLPNQRDLLEQYNCHLVAGWLRLIDEWQALCQQTRLQRGRFGAAAPMLRPTYFWENERLASTVGSGHQEDAQELLMIMLDGLHSELLELRSLLGEKSKLASLERAASPSLTDSDATSDTEWETVDRRGRSAIVRTHQVRKTFITSIFGGALRSEVRKAGAKRSAVREPFLMLSLDIEDQRIRTLDDAFRYFMEPEFLEAPDERDSSARTRTRVAANLDPLRKHVTLDTPLPQALIIHLKRFSVASDGTGQGKKLHKELSFPPQFVLNASWFSAAVPKAQLGEACSRRYRLVAVITHLGTDLANGHYIADVLASGTNSTWSSSKSRNAPRGLTRSVDADAIWWQCDDQDVQMVSASTVLSRAAYVLVYRNA